MNTLGKVVIVFGGYAAALLVANILVAIRVAHTSGPDAQASAGMYAWGDFTLFAWSFGLMALIPTALGLYFLRPYEKVWTVLSVVSLAVATTGLVGAGAAALVPHLQLPGSTWEMVAGLGFLRALGAPLLALGFFTGAALAPARRSRWALLVAGGFECAATAYVIIHLWVARMPYHHLP